MVKSIVSTLISVALAALIAQARAAPLGFSAALKIAESAAPELVLDAATLDATKANSISAGRLPDPKLLLGFENVPVNGEDAWSLSRDFMTMSKVGFMQEIPNHGKRKAAHDAAVASVGKAEAEQRVRILQIRRATALAWINRYYIERRGGLLDELERENQLFGGSVQAQVVAGRAVPADTVAPKQEAAELADRRDLLGAQIGKAKAELSRWIGNAAQEPLDGAPPELAIDAPHLREHVHLHPELAAFVPMTEMAQAELREAQAAKRPDWGVEFSFAKRGPDFSDMVNLQFTVGLPIFGGNRQDPQIEAKRQSLRKVDAERAAMLKDHTRELEVDLAEYEALNRQLERMQNTRLPLGQEKVDFQFASYRGGKGDLNAVLAARRELIDLKFKQLELEAERKQLAAKLYFIYGEGAQ